MEGAKSDCWVDCRRDIFGSEVIDITLEGEYFVLRGLTFVFPKTQKKVCQQLQIPATKIFGVEFIKKKKQTNNWFEKLFSKKQEWIRIYY